MIPRDLLASKLFVILGPCVIETRDHAFMMAERLKVITDKVGIPFIFKASYDKANRSSIKSFRGPGMEEGLKILRDIRDQVKVPVLSDVHESWQVPAAAEVLDVIQIPAFLCRQTDLLAAAAKTGKPVNIKKGQFLSPWEMENVVIKMNGNGKWSDCFDRERNNLRLQQFGC